MIRHKTTQKHCPVSSDSKPNWANGVTSDFASHAENIMWGTCCPSLREILC